MKKQNGRVLSFFLVLMTCATAARADLVTLAPLAPTVIDFSQFARGPTFTFGPAQIGRLVGLDVVFTANPAGGGNSGQGSVLGAVGYGLGGNGEWGGDKTYSGVDSAIGAMTYTFNFGLVSAVGGFMNYVPGLPDVIIEALDAGGNVLESHVLNREAPISSPGGVNAGAFRGIQRQGADIGGFRISNAYVVLDDLAFTSAQVPEPGTLFLFASGAASLAARRYRRRAKLSF